MKNTIRSLLTEYGIGWTINRCLYSAKLKMMSQIPPTEKIFEKKVDIKRIDIFDFDLSLIKDFLINLDIEKQQGIIDIADKAINGMITGFSSIDLDYGEPINWHINPITGVENKRDIKWYRISDFDKKTGDIKVIWEASRLTHFLYFARAYLITDNIKYYTAFIRQLKHWLKNNPYSYGSNYKCGQEATLRMTNVLITYSVFKEFDLVTKEDEKYIYDIVEASYKKVLSNFFYARKCIKNNHTFSEILGLIIGAWCNSDDVKLEKAYNLMDKEISHQFLPDGGFTQYSFNYHRFALQIFEVLFKISEKTGVSIEQIERIKDSVLLLYHIQAKNGDVPNYGSNDGALIFPLTTCAYRDFRPVLNTMYALITGKRLYENGLYDEELLWFGKTLDLPTEVTEKKPAFFNDTGFYSFRHNGGFLMIYLQDFRSRPSHMDQLHIDLWHKGVNIFCDCGTYSYASEVDAKLSATAGHNTAKLPNIEQMNKKGTFLVTNWTKRKSVHYTDKKFTGTMVSQNGYEHTRSIIKMDWGYRVLDEVRGFFETCEFNFHTPCVVKVTPLGISLFHKGKLICTVITDGTVNVEKTYRSLYYFKKDDINCISVKGNFNNKKCNMKFDIKLNE